MKEIVVREGIIQDGKVKPGKIIMDTCPFCGRHIVENGCCLDGNNMGADLCQKCHSGGFDLTIGPHVCSNCGVPYYITEVPK